MANEVEQFELLQKSAVTIIAADLVAESEASRLAAQEAASTATTKANEAGASSVKASQWAENNEDVAVETGKFSAKHYSIKAAAQNAQMQAVYPLAAYRARVLADAGNIQDLNKLTELYIKNLQLLESTVGLFTGLAGMKTRTSGSNQFASKWYNMANKVQQFGAEKVLNGTFTTNTDNWTPGSGAELSVDTNRLKVTNKTSFGQALQSITTVAGKANHLTYSVTKGVGNYKVQVTDLDGTVLYDTGTLSDASKTDTVRFVAKSTTSQVRLISMSTVADEYVFFDNISVKQMDWVDGSSDATQTTEANQLYVGGLISANEARILKTGGISADFFSIPAISFASNEEWTITLGFKWNGDRNSESNNGTLLTGTGIIYCDASKNGSIIHANPPAQNIFQTTSGILNRFVGRNCILQYIYRKGSYQIILNNEIIANIVTPYEFAMSINSLYGVLNRNSTDTNHFQINYKALSESERQAQHDFLRLQIPEIEGMPIGNQYWPTSNLELALTSAGTAIPEQQDNATWAGLSTSAWSYHTNSVGNGVIYGKIYNGHAAVAIAGRPPVGYRVMSLADWQQLSAVIGANSNKLKVAGTEYWANALGTNETGFTAIGGGYRNADGTFSTLKADVWYWTSDKYLVKISSANGTITTTDASTTMNIGAYIRLLRNSPVGPNETTVTTGTIINALGAGNLDIVIPFGYAVDSIKVISKTGITGLSAKYCSRNPATLAVTELDTLFTAKTVVADVPKMFNCNVDQTIQRQDAVVRINGTKADTAAEFEVRVNIKKVVL